MVSFTVRFTDPEAKLVKVAAAGMGFNVPLWLRTTAMAAINPPVPVPPQDIEDGIADGGTP